MQLNVISVSPNMYVSTKITNKKLTLRTCDAQASNVLE